MHFLYRVPQVLNSEQSSELLQHFQPYPRELKKPLPTTFAQNLFGQSPQNSKIYNNIAAPIFLLNARFLNEKAETFLRFLELLRDASYAPRA